ncbi:MAG: TolC family protein [Gammaproteobacteria bacterium]|nr:TolC family protein [Gammaproteobacteria bacterium]
MFLPILLGATVTAHAVEPPVLSLQEALATALAGNPGLAQRRAETEARAAIPLQSGTLPDPSLTLEPGRAAMTQFRLGITQELPYPGKLKLQRSIAQQEAEASSLETGGAVLRLTAEVKQAWWRLFYLDRALSTVRRNQTVMRQLVEVAQTRYRVGQGLQQDVLLAEVELAKLLSMEAELEGQRRGAEARLNTLMYWPVAKAITLPMEVSELLPELPAEKELLDRAATRPEVLVRQRNIEAATNSLALARKDYRPDFMVGANYEWREGEADMKSVMLTMTLPIHTASRQDKAVDQRSAELMAQRFALQETEAQVAVEVATALADYQRARRQVVLLKTGVIPQANLSVVSMLAGYQVGKVDFLNLAQARVTLYEYETRYWQALSEARMALAQLDAAVGQEVVHE